MTVFRTSFAENIFMKYMVHQYDTWDAISFRTVQGVCKGLMSPDEIDQLILYVQQMKFIPGGRYLFYSGTALRYWNNCYLFRALEDTREELADFSWRMNRALLTGGGAGGDYSILRGKGEPCVRSRGIAAGPISLMRAVNDTAREWRQGGGRRAALYASLMWNHQDAPDLIHAKDWSPDVRTMKDKDQNFTAPLDMTNISLNYDDAFMNQVKEEGSRAYYQWYEAIRQMLKTGEPGCSFNFGRDSNETLRNACCEVTSEDDSDVCNLGSVNISRISNINELADVVHLGSKFLVCGSIGAELPFKKVYDVRAKNRRIGLGMMGIHEWLLRRNYSYQMNQELQGWLYTYEWASVEAANEQSDKLSINRPIKYRAIAPTGTIGILASTTTGIEPVFATAYKRRYVDNGGNLWKHEYVVDGTADYLIKKFDLEPDSIETAYSLAADPEKRIKFQYEVQKYVDHAISSTINLPAWDSLGNNDETVEDFADMLLRYAPGLRGITVYPDGARGGQPLTEVPYEWALQKKGVVYDENEERCISGVCGI